MFPSIFNAPFLPQPKARENAFSKLYIIGIEKWTNELAEKKEMWKIIIMVYVVVFYGGTFQLSLWESL